MMFPPLFDNLPPKRPNKERGNKSSFFNLKKKAQLKKAQLKKLKKFLFQLFCDINITKETWFT